MRVYFINLDRDDARRAHMTEALQGLDHERIAAIDGRNLPTTSSGPTRFELACIESHRAAWRKFLTTPAPFACFLEDDVHFSDDFPSFVNDDSWIPADAHAVKLDTFFNWIMLGSPLTNPKGRRLARLFTRHESCAAYILSRRGAEFFLRATQKPDRPVDYIVFPEDPAGQGLFIYQLAPAAALQDYFFLRHYEQGKNFVSGIGKLDVVKPVGKAQKILFTLKREGVRLYRQVFRVRRYLVNRLVRRLRPEIVPFL